MFKMQKYQNLGMVNCFPQFHSISSIINTSNLRSQEGCIRLLTDGVVKIATARDE